MIAAETSEGLIRTLTVEEALPLARRVAGRLGLAWPEERRAVAGVGGFRLEVTHHPGLERVVWATLGKQDGVLGLFTDSRLLSVANHALGQVLRIQPVNLPGLPGHALMVDDQVDQMTGAFFREERRSIYVWDGRSLRLAFRGPLLREQFRHARWENPKGPFVWRQERTRGQITLQSGQLTEHLVHERLEAPGAAREPMPSPGKFRTIARESVQRRYAWNPRLRRFDPIQPR